MFEGAVGGLLFPARYRAVSRDVATDHGARRRTQHRHRGAATAVTELAAHDTADDPANDLTRHLFIADRILAGVAGVCTTRQQPAAEGGSGQRKPESRRFLHDVLLSLARHRKKISRGRRFAPLRSEFPCGFRILPFCARVDVCCARTGRATTPVIRFIQTRRAVGRDRLARVGSASGSPAGQGFPLAVTHGVPRRRWRAGSCGR